MSSINSLQTIKQTNITLQLGPGPVISDLMGICVGVEGAYCDYRNPCCADEGLTCDSPLKGKCVRNRINTGMRNRNQIHEYCSYIPCYSFLVKYVSNAVNYLYTKAKEMNGASALEVSAANLQNVVMEIAPVLKLIVGAPNQNQKLSKTCSNAW